MLRETGSHGIALYMKHGPPADRNVYPLAVTG